MGRGGDRQGEIREPAHRPSPSRSAWSRGQHSPMRGMACTPTRNEENKGSGLSQAATSLGGGPVSLSRSEELLTRISTELTNEALFIAGYHMNPVPTKGKQTQDRGTQISNHVFFTKTRGTDTHSDRNRTRTKAHLLPSPCDKNMPQSSSFTTH
uniref:Uncharacterized protein n=2 Tax=Equus TaxID=9789 RepID=A0A9L0RR92_HORSE